MTSNMLSADASVRLASALKIDKTYLATYQVGSRLTIPLRNSLDYLKAANKVCETDGRKPELVVLRGLIHRQSPQSESINSMKLSKSLILMVPRGGIEPPTRGFSIRYSTD